MIRRLRDEGPRGVVRLRPASAYERREWRDEWGSRRWAVIGPAGAVELYDMTKVEPEYGMKPLDGFEWAVARDGGWLAGPAAPKATGMFVVHLHSPDAVVADLPPESFTPYESCRYVEGGCRAAHNTMAESAIGASALELARESARGPLWLLLATVYGVYFADRRVVAAVLREAAT